MVKHALNIVGTCLLFILTSLVFAEDTALPHLYIETEDEAVITPDGNKKTYVNASLVLVNGGETEIDTTMRIRGRGNSTWMYGNLYGKKPFRMKLDTAQELLGLPAARNWILLANIIDSSLMANAIAFEVAHMLELPFTHTMIPVDVTVNGEYQGNYMLTEHKEVMEHRIDIGEGGVLFEMDSHFDQPPYQFEDAAFGLPIMLQYPKVKKWDDEAGALAAFQAYEADLQHVLNLIADPAFPNNHYEAVFDIDAFVRFVLVFALSANQELNYPKSVYLYKAEGSEQYRMGPVWDFDWTFGYNEWIRKHYVNPEEPLFWEADNPGKLFFERVLSDPQVASLLASTWVEFRDTHFADLLEFTTQYAHEIADSFERDYEVWGDIPLLIHREPTLVPNELERILEWLEHRVEYLDRWILTELAQ